MTSLHMSGPHGVSPAHPPTRAETGSRGPSHALNVLGNRRFLLSRPVVARLLISEATGIDGLIASNVRRCLSDRSIFHEPGRTVPLASAPCASRGMLGADPEEAAH